MKYCSKCGKSLPDASITCPDCGQSDPIALARLLEDKVSVGLCILSAIIPFFGFIYWIVQHKEKPTKALGCGLTALIIWLINCAIFLVCIASRV